jgi:hypothetical protein
MREIYKNVKKEIKREPLSTSSNSGVGNGRGRVQVGLPANPNLSPIVDQSGVKPRPSVRGRAQRSLRSLPPKDGPVSSTMISVKDKENT